MCLVPIHSVLLLRFLSRWSELINISLALVNVSLVSVSCSKILFVVYTVMGIFSFSMFSFTSFFTIPCASASSSVMDNDSSYNDSCFCETFCFSTLIYFILRYIFLLSIISFINYVVGRVFIMSLNFYAFSYETYSLCSIASNYASSIKWDHTWVISSYKFMHSSSKLLTLSMVFMVLFSFFSLSSFWVLDVLWDSKSTIFTWNPSMVSLIFVTFSYKGLSYSICTSRMFLYTTRTSYCNLVVLCVASSHSSMSLFYSTCR